ncbi:DUF4326 domain-containing protein [Thermus sp. 93170]|uniref:DUF4326 domain-containing protein n=1 Tax=Thermus sp. 93170 TaxID=1046939 RepID=UPI003F41C5E1
MRGGCWDASAFAEEVQAALEDWLKGELDERQALKVILDAAYEYNFAPQVLVVRLVRGGRFVRGATYIGRPTRFGNPFPVEVWGREEAVRRYREHFAQKLGDPTFWEALESLYQRLKSRGGITLSCHCAPLPCHGEVIGAWLVNRAREEGLAARVVVEGRDA